MNTSLVIKRTFIFIGPLIGSLFLNKEKNNNLSVLWYNIECLKKICNSFNKIVMFVIRNNLVKDVFIANETPTYHEKLYEDFNLIELNDELMDEIEEMIIKINLLITIITSVVKNLIKFLNDKNIYLGQVTGTEMKCKFEKNECGQTIGTQTIKFIEKGACDLEYMFIYKSNLDLVNLHYNRLLERGHKSRWWNKPPTDWYGHIKQNEVKSNFVNCEFNVLFAKDLYKKMIKLYNDKKLYMNTDKVIKYK